MAAREDERVMLSELALVAGVSVLAVSEYTRRHELSSPTPMPAG